jgi:hypothetical protein
VWVEGVPGGGGGGGTSSEVGVLLGLFSGSSRIVLGAVAGLLYCKHEIQLHPHIQS